MVQFANLRGFVILLAEEGELIRVFRQYLFASDEAKHSETTFSGSFDE
jgi:hypothetical protein